MPPIIRLEVERMKLNVLAALTDYAAKMDEEIKAAVEEACTPDKISAIVRQSASDAINATIEKEIDDFFRYGAGRAVVRQAVLETFEEKVRLSDEEKGG